MRARRKGSAVALLVRRAASPAGFGCPGQPRTISTFGRGSSSDWGAVSGFMPAETKGRASSVAQGRSDTRRGELRAEHEPRDGAEPSLGRIPDEVHALVGRAEVTIEHRPAVLVRIRLRPRVRERRGDRAEAVAAGDQDVVDLALRAVGELTTSPASDCSTFVTVQPSVIRTLPSTSGRSHGEPPGRRSRLSDGASRRRGARRTDRGRARAG